MRFVTWKRSGTRRADGIGRAARSLAWCAMNVVFLDTEDQANSLNGTVIGDRQRLFQIFAGLHDRPPFICWLTGENGFRVDVGIGPLGFVQYSRNDGEPPYLVAVSPRIAPGDYTAFLCGSTPTEIPNRYCMPFELVREIAGHFLETGRTHPTFSWESI